MHRHTHPENLPLHKAEHDTGEKDGDDDDHKQKARAAAGMVAGLLAGIFHGQLQPGLVAENRLMLGAVIGKDAFDILLLGAEDQIAQKNGYLHHALDQIVQSGTVNIRIDQARQKGGQQHKQHQGQADGQQYGKPHQHLLHFFLRYVCLNPLIQLARLAHLLLGEIVRRIHQRLDAAYHGVNKSDRPANDGPA